MLTYDLSSSYSIQVLWYARYVTMRDTGQVIQTVAVSDCHNGPHEVRGIVRNDMINVLADALPEGTIQFGCGVTSVGLSTDGASTFFPVNI